MSPLEICPHCGGSLPTQAVDGSPEFDPNAERSAPTVGSAHSDDQIAPDALLMAESGPDHLAIAADLLGDSTEVATLAPLSHAEHEAPSNGEPKLAWTPPHSTTTSREALPAADSGEMRHERQSLLRAWGRLLLTSYASALTLALCWLVVTGRVKWGPGSGKADHDSQTVATQDERSSLPTIPPDHLAQLGETMRVGNLEVTPLEIRADGVWLRNVTMQEGNFRKGGIDSYWLRLKLRNVSTMDEFAPLDAALLRATDQGGLDALIVTETDRVPMFPLAQTSEWVVDGEDFAALAPGEEREFVIASSPGTSRKASARMTWRMRVRVAPNQTELIGVEFMKSDVK